VNIFCCLHIFGKVKVGFDRAENGQYLEHAPVNFLTKVESDDVIKMHGCKLSLEAWIGDDGMEKLAKRFGKLHAFQTSVQHLVLLLGATSLFVV
jgi:hypothetical protein